LEEEEDEEEELAAPVEVTVMVSAEAVAVTMEVASGESSRCVNRAEVFTATRARARIVGRCMLGSWFLSESQSSSCSDCGGQVMVKKKQRGDGRCPVLVI